MPASVKLPQIEMFHFCDVYHNPSMDELVNSKIIEIYNKYRVIPTIEANSTCIIIKYTIDYPA